MFQNQTIQREVHAHKIQLLDNTTGTGPWLPDWVTSSTWFKVLAVYLIIQAVFGIIALEWAWSKSKKFRNQSEEKFDDDRLWDLARTDPQKWARWKLYPGAMFTLLTRIILLILNALLLIIFLKIFICGHDFKKKGQIRRGCRRSLITFFGCLSSRIMLFVVGMYTYTTYKDVDYSYFLGPDYKKKMSKKTTSTVIANHVSWLDPIVFGRRFMPSMAPKAGLKHTPLVNVLADAIGSLYIPRGGTREEKDNILNLIKERQEVVEDSNDSLPPLLIFPEGTTNNGQTCFLFKKGAFLAEKKIRPYTLNYSNGTVCPAWEVIDILPIAIMLLSWGCYTCHLQKLPDFEPNEYLFTTHSDMGKERWEIYAWALREIITEHGKLTGSSVPFRVKRVYCSYMNNEKGAIHPNDLTEENAPPEVLKSQKSLRFIRQSLLKRSKSELMDKKDKGDFKIGDQKNMFKSQVQLVREPLV